MYFGKEADHPLYSTLAPDSGSLEAVHLNLVLYLTAGDSFKQKQRRRMRTDNKCHQLKVIAQLRCVDIQLSDVIHHCIVNHVDVPVYQRIMTLTFDDSFANMLYQ